ncbi:hypothetical protein BRADI_3g37745v3 [Brachypodium distachyon]|uniref:Secreted protein n=1 Tax=Brachypodium distachyon TaxID=15368 RepID=A0A2K2D1T0_BRADI|nr:hypothetical protein BRADI_3g37745v3 [Brachypodium distachyon]
MPKFLIDLWHVFLLDLVCRSAGPCYWRRGEACGPEDDIPVGHSVERLLGVTEAAIGREKHVEVGRPDGRALRPFGFLRVARQRKQGTTEKITRDRTKAEHILT